MSEQITLKSFLMNLSSASSLDSLYVMTVNSQGEFLKMTAVDLAESLLHLIFNPQSYAQNIDEIVTAGIYLVEMTQSSGTFPDTLLPQYGHLIVLRRGGTVQQIMINRTAISLRFMAYFSQSQWSDWTTLT